MDLVGAALFAFQKGASFFSVVLRPRCPVSNPDSADTHSRSLSNRTRRCSATTAWGVWPTESVEAFQSFRYNGEAKPHAHKPEREAPVKASLK